MRLLSLEEVTTKTTLSKACVNRLVRRGEFPRSRQIGSLRRVAWLEEEIDDWILSSVTRRPVL
jgi:prophage regulatory protein